MAQWRTATCSICNGRGIINNGYDEPMDCPYCSGGGIFISPKGRIAEYPGGRFLGHATEGEIARSVAYQPQTVECAALSDTERGEKP